MSEATRFNSANKGLPLPLGRGVCETKSKNGRSRPRKPFISRGFLRSEAFRDHGLRPWSRKGPDHGVGVDPETVIQWFSNLKCNDFEKNGSLTTEGSFGLRLLEKKKTGKCWFWPPLESRKQFAAFGVTIFSMLVAFLLWKGPLGF